MPANPELQWLAGLIDESGLFQLRVMHHRTKTLGIRPRFGPLVTFSLTKNQIARLKAIEGRVRIYSRNGRHYADFYANSLRKLLPSLIPHLTKKKEKAEIMVQILNVLNERRFMGKAHVLGRRPYSDEEIEQLLNLKRTLALAK